MYVIVQSSPIFELNDQCQIDTHNNMGEAMKDKPASLKLSNKLRLVIPCCFVVDSLIKFNFVKYVLVNDSHCSNFHVSGHHMQNSGI